MRVIVTGAAGFIGSNLVLGLNRIGIDDVIAVDDLTDGPKYRNLLGARISDYFDKREFYARFARGEFGKVDAVLHQGACSDTMEHDGRFMLDNNYRCSKDLLDAAQAQGTRLLSGDLVEFDATPYAGDAYFKDWPQTLENVAALKPLALVPGRGPALVGESQVAAGLKATGGFIADVRDSVAAGVAAGKDLNTVYKDTFAKLKPKYGHWVIFDHCMPFDVTRAYDEATQFPDPRIWTAERDRIMWEALEG